MGLEVDIGGAVAQCLGNKQVDYLNHRGVIGNGGDSRCLRGSPASVRLFKGLDVSLDVTESAVCSIYRSLNIGARGDDKTHVTLSSRGKVLLRLLVWISDHHCDASVIDIDRDGDIRPGHALGQHR